MSLTSKLVGNEEERAVSPVIGVILMVAITVILAAVIAAFVLDLGQSQSASPAAAFEFDQDGSDLKVTLISEDRVDSSPGYEFTSSGASGDHQCSSGSISGFDVGSSCSVDNWDQGDDVVIVAEYQGNTGVVASYSG